MRASRATWARRESEGIRDLKANRATRDPKDQKEVTDPEAKQDPWDH